MYERFVLPHLHGKPPSLRSAGECALHCEAMQGTRKTAWKSTIDRKDDQRTPYFAMTIINNQN